MEHIVYCWNCSSAFDVFEANWCGCSGSHPSKVCPFCYNCACTAPAPYAEEYRRNLPASLVAEMPNRGRPKKRIGEILVERGRITREQLAAVLDEQRTTGMRLGDLLVQNGLMTRAEVARHLADQQELQQADVDPRRLNADLIRTVGAELCLRHRFVPLDRQELSHVKVLIIAVAEPMSPHELDKLGERVSCTVYQKFAPPDQVRVALERIHRLESGTRPPGY